MAIVDNELVGEWMKGDHYTFWTPPVTPATVVQVIQENIGKYGDATWMVNDSLCTMNKDLIFE